MGITIADGKTIETLVYENIFMVRLDVRQKHQDMHAPPAVFDVTIMYRMFAVDAEGRRQYSGEGIQKAKLEDFLTFAQSKAAAGNMVPFETFAQLQLMVALVVAEQRGTEASTY